MAHNKARADVENILKKLRDEPVGTEGVNDRVLVLPFDYLMSIGRHQDGKLHWFCEQSDAVAIEAATFLLRLFAYRNERVDSWKKRLIYCLHGCSACVRSFVEVKYTSRSTYFGTFLEEVVWGFWAEFDKWLAKSTREALAKAGVTAESRKSLADAPAAIVYLMVSTLPALEDSNMVNLIETHCPPSRIFEWPVDPPPPGIILLLMHDSQHVRHWAKSQMTPCKPMTKDQFSKSYELSLDAIIASIASNDRSFFPGALVDRSKAAPVISFVSANPDTIWSGMATLFRILPPECLVNSSIPFKQMDLRRMVLGHLHDNADHFVDVLRCTVYLIKKLGSSTWVGASEDYPKIVFDAIKDNPAFSKLLALPEAVSEKPWFLNWFAEYLRTLWETPVFGDVLAKIIGFMFDELQHERFEKSRPTVTAAAFRLLSAVAHKCATEKASGQYAALTHVIDVHSEFLVAVAIGREYSKPNWNHCREAALVLLRQLFNADVDNLASTVANLANALPPVTSPTIPIFQPVRIQLWERAYSTLQANDGQGTELLLTVVSRIWYIDQLNKQAFTSSKLPLLTNTTTKETFDSTVDNVNHAMSVFRSGFLDSLSKYANYTSSTKILEFLQRENIVKYLIASMFSPVEHLHVAAQALVGQAFDVDDRVDCFRALLENLPGASLQGIMEVLESFNEFAPSITEACSVSKSLVRCMTDIIDVMCNRSNGLLLNSRHVLGGLIALEDQNIPPLATELPKMWKLMTNAIAVIFRRTPLWAPYFDSNSMVEWMRDALIFGRDLLAERRCFESAALGTSNQSFMDKSPRKLSKVGRRMVDGLQNVLLELTRWLRLTDEELLHQSFTLLQSLLDCFRETRIPPNPEAVTKLTKFIDDGRSNGARSVYTRLDSSRLSRLEEALGMFDDQEIEIISRKVRSQPFATKPEPQKKHTGFSTQPKFVKQPVAGQKSLNRVVEKSDGKTPKPIANAPSVSSGASSKAPSHEDKTRSSIVLPSRVAGAPKYEGGRKVSASEPSGKDLASSQSSSSDDDDDDDEPGGGGLDSLSKLQRSPKKSARTAERRQIKIMEPVGQVSRAVQDRRRKREDAHRISMRLKPDISPLHRTILSWNYDHDGPDPPFVGQKPTLRRVPERFHDYQEYRELFEPLLLYESWSQIMKSKEETQIESYGCKIVSRQFTDDWLDLDVSIEEAVKKDWYLGDADVVLLRKDAGSKSIMGKASGFKRTPLGLQMAIRCFIVMQSCDPGLHANTTWRISKVFSLTTLHREYAALMSLPYYDLSEQIIKPRLSSVPPFETSEVKRAMSSFQVNEPQAKAILASMKTDGFSLIQGPPGTGKTWTICGLVGAFLSYRRKAATVITAGRTSDGSERQPPRKVLVCAPSNAAIDELAKRLVEGVRDSNGVRIVPKVVRIGADTSMNISVRDISLDSLVELKLNSKDNDIKGTKPTGTEIAVLRTEIETVKRLKQQKQEELANIHDNASKCMALEKEIERLNSKRMTLSQQVDQLRDKQRSDTRALDAARRKFRHEVLNEADVICGTLSGTGHEQLEQFEFEMVIIDEAAQSIELSSLIPLKYNCNRCIMVGDPQQLPPTVLSPEATKWGYDQSLFVRIQKHNPAAAHLLSIQYRMHPEISHLPSRIFYDRRLTDGRDMAKKTSQPWHTHPTFGVYKFFNVTRGREEQGLAHSLLNKAECQVILAMFDRLRLEFSSVSFDFRVGIISMYRAQVMELRRTFKDKYGPDILNIVDFNSVDGFQGQEKDIIILSCVRAGPGVQSVGFLADTRRMNVAITRARSSLFIVGHAPTLERSNATWKQIVEDARTRHSLLEVDVADFRSAAGGRISKRPQKLPLPTEEGMNLPEMTPTDLVTPKAFIQSQVQAQSSAPVGNGDSLAKLSTAALTSSESSEVQTAKRTISEENDSARPPLKVRKTEDLPSNKVAVKRPKPPASIFIPKKPSRPNASTSK
ncbi:hypothetical protein BD410DRAFT_898486 [Rickenella mellea]|uniref:Helicase ATP-binding domain-containing protein n=1 Tax=Rickenella mellea TaxID=50990 RepID=A0A4Y7Q3K3_9AGAM|nr:hypothetical protein BD410DRAFT_898486 [Rickenella mellea]